MEEINKQGVSIVISARNEEKTLPMTISSLTEDLYASGITKWEVIVVDNGSEDETSRFFAWRPVEKGGYWQYQYSPRGLVAEGKLRLLFDPVMSNVNARNNGVRHARYENIIFADAHITVRHGTILSTLNALNKFGGIIHAPVAWMGASPENPNPGYQYSYKIGEKGPYGTWNKIKIADTPFYIPICGHCWLAVKKTEFQEKGGYPKDHRVYGGGEPYLDSVWWMTGSSVMCDPGSLVFHLSAGRDYAWHSDDLLHNSILVAYILSGQKLADRVLITYANKWGLNPVLKRLYDEALSEGQEAKEWLDKNKIMTFEEMLALDKEPDCKGEEYKNQAHPKRVWDIKNDELHGKHCSLVHEFKLEKRDDKVFIGNTQIVNKDALKIASKYV